MPMTNGEGGPSVRRSAAARAIGLTKTYGEGDAAVCALDGVSVEFEAGRYTAIMGPSGSGKSTLLHCMAGLDTPTDGKVLIGDVDLTTLSEKQLTLLRRQKVGFVFQAYNLVPTLTAAENITLPLDIAGEKADAAWFDEVVDTIGIRDRLTTGRAALRRPTAARGRRLASSVGRRSCTRRADREPDSRGGRAPVVPEERRRITPDDRDGHHDPPLRATGPGRVLPTGT
jgi:putative ABC transport system ATP-binding protein